MPTPRDPQPSPDAAQDPGLTDPAAPDMSPPTRTQKLGLLFFAAMVVFVFTSSWHSYLSFRPDAPGDFGTVTGTLADAVETSRDVLDLHLAGDSLRYRVAKDWDRSGFDCDAFLADVHPGDRGELSVRTAEIGRGHTALLDRTPSIFVHGIRSGGRDYCRVDDFIAWQYRNHGSALTTAIIGSCCLGFLLFFLGMAWRKWKTGQH